MPEMKRLALGTLCLSVMLGACLPASNSAPTQATLSDADLQGTAAVLSQQTLDAMAVIPSETARPSETALIAPPSPTETAAAEGTATETQNAALLTLTATLGAETTTATNTAAASPSPSATLNPAGVTATQTLHAQYYGTLPPKLPFGDITLINKSKAEAYISLQCTTRDGYVTILEYPVKGTMQVNAPAGSYIYVAWVGGKKMTGQFKLGKSQSLKITLNKNSIEVK